MGVRFHARADGTVAIYTGDGEGFDDDPMDDPLGNLARVVFHSGLRYPAIIAEHTGTLSLPSRATNSGGSAGHTLFAHGRPGTPLVIGYATLSGNRVRLAGSVPVQFDGNGKGYGRWIAIGADATNVVMAENYFTQATAGFSGIDVDWVAYVLAFMFDADLDPPDNPNERLYISPTDFRAGDFNARNRYLRAGNSASDFPLVRGGKTVDMNLVNPTNFNRVTTRYSLNGYTQTSTGVTAGSSFDADFDLVTI